MQPALAKLLATPIAHRGLHACGAPGPVENSLGAAAAAIAAGYGIECDVQLSRDGEAMVFHDAQLERLTAASGLVADHDAAALTAIRLAHRDDRIPTLADFLAAVAGRVPIVIEIKSEGSGEALTDRVLAVIAGYSGVVALESFDPAVVLRCRQKRSRVPVGLVGPPDASRPDRDAVDASDFLSWGLADLDSAAAFGLPISTWTVRTPADQDKAARLGAQIVFEGFRPRIS